MAYYLTDPYYFLPKSYPYLGEGLGYTAGIISNRPTYKGRQIETESAIRRLDLAQSRNADRTKCEENLLKYKYKAMGRENA